MKILVIDDQILFREGLTGMLAAQPDFEVVGEAGTVKDALIRARETRPDVILMDYSLPDGEGPQATQAILAELPLTKVVFLTVHDADDRLMAAISSGAKGYLLKDLPFSKLAASIRDIDRDESVISSKMAFRILNEFSRIKPKMEPVVSELADFSVREVQILRELALDASNREIARHLSLSIPTVKNHIHKIISKLNVKNRQEVARFSRRQGLGEDYTSRTAKKISPS